MTRVLLALAVATSASACGVWRGGDSSDVSAAEANARLRTMIDGTAAEIAEGLPITPAPDRLAPTPCTDASGKDLESTSLAYSVALGLSSESDVPALFERTRAYWESQDFDVGEVEGLDGSLPSLRSERDGYGMTLRIDREAVIAFIDGGTLCVKGVP